MREFNGLAAGACACAHLMEASSRIFSPTKKRYCRNGNLGGIGTSAVTQEMCGLPAVSFCPNHVWLVSAVDRLDSAVGTSCLGRSCIRNSSELWLFPGEPCWETREPFSSHRQASKQLRSDRALAKLSGQVMFQEQGRSAMGSLLQAESWSRETEASEHLRLPQGYKLCLSASVPAKSDTNLPQSQDPRQPASRWSGDLQTSPGVGVG